MSSNFIHFFIVAQDKETKSPLGAIYCLMSKTDPEKIVRVPVFGVSPEAQSRGIGKLLMSSILKYIPSAKKIALSTRITNERAIKAYHAWGFVPAPNTMEHWANLEYIVEQANGLQ
jgi:ribosomal protein S18 acetylase RimI-like enzyme